MSNSTEGYGKQWSEDYRRGYTRGCESRDAEIAALKARVAECEKYHWVMKPLDVQAMREQHE